MTRKLILAALALAPLCACVSVLPEPPKPPRIYTLMAAQTARSNAPATAPLVIAVAAPTGPRALMGAKMVWRRDGVIAYVESVEWAGRLPDLLQTVLVDTLDAEAVVRAGVRVGAGVRAEYEIQWDISAFEVHEQGGARTAHVAGSARLVQARSRELVEMMRFERSDPLTERSSGAAALALEALARDAASDIARSFSIQAIAHASAASSNR